MLETRGRPKENHELPPRQFIREYKEHTGQTEIWTYDLDKFSNGPINVDINYPKNYESPLEKLNRVNKNLPITQQRFINPINGKEIGYQRAHSLGII